MHIEGKRVHWDAGGTSQAPGGVNIRGTGPWRGGGSVLPVQVEVEVEQRRGAGGRAGGVSAGIFAILVVLVIVMVVGHLLRKHLLDNEDLLRRLRAHCRRGGREGEGREAVESLLALLGGKRGDRARGGMRPEMIGGRAA